MKILLTTDSYFPRVGGQEITTFRLAKYLRKHGHRVRIFTTEKHSWSGPEEGDLEVERAPHRFDLSGKRWLRARLRQLFTDADVVHSQYCYRLAALSAPIARKLGRRFLVSLHGLGLFDNPQDSWLRRWSHRRYRRLSLSLADAVIATSDEFGRHAAQYVQPGKVHVIPNGVDTDQLLTSPPAPPDLSRKYAGAKVILALGRLVPTKGFQFLIQAAPQVLCTHPNARFVIGGSGPLEAELKALARRLQVETGVDFVGAIPNAEVAGYLSLARMGVFPSTAESTSLACLEAMALGRPVVVSRIRGFEELLGSGEHGVLVDLFETREYQRKAPPGINESAVTRLAQAINRILDDPERARRLGEAGRNHVLARFDWNRLVERILELYRGQDSRAA